MKLISLQYMRAVAAMMVVFDHALIHSGAIDRLNQAIPTAYADMIAHAGLGGVDIFFVISGFVMWYTTEGSNTTPRSFYVRRLIRIVPLYWLFTLLIVAFMFVAPQLLSTSRWDAWHVVASLLFIPATHPVMSTFMFPVIIPGWTLNYEMFFYLLFGASLLLRADRRLIAILGLLVLLSALPVEPGLNALSFYTSTLLLEFAVGICIGWLAKRSISLPHPIAIMAIIAGFAGIASLMPQIPTNGAFRGLFLALPAGLIIWGAVSLEMSGSLLRMRWLELLGDASYAIYLSHVISLPAAIKVLGMIGMRPGPLFVVLPAELVLTAAAGVVAHLLIEKPLTRWLRSFPQRRTVAMPA